MLVASIREDKNNYYINLERKDNNYCYQVVCANNKKTYILSEEEAKSIINKMFQSKLTYLKKENGYTIYLDEANNKRFFQKDKEDLVMFFLNNGKNAILHKEKESILDLKNKWNNIKNFVMKKEHKVIVYSMSLFLSSIIINSFVEEVAYYIDNLIAYEKALNSLPNSDFISYNDMISYIRDSNDKMLTKDMRDYFINYDLFSHILEVTDSSRNYILRKKLNNIGLKYYSEKEKEEKENSDGYYITSDLNHIH